MKKEILTLAILCIHSLSSMAQDTLWVRYDDRFKANYSLPLKDIDSIEVKTSILKLYSTTVSAGYKTLSYASIIPTEKATIQFVNPGAYLLKPSTYSGTNYENSNATSGYNFAHSMESEHFALFWDVRYGEEPTKIQYPGDSNVANANSILNICEQCWKKYLELGFVVPGQSLTDKYKIQLYIPYQKEWRADASGTDGANGGRTGIGHFNPWAAVARDGHTVAHEVGHTFQYLTSANTNDFWGRGFNYGYGDGGSGGNGWWESCADWQAYKVFPHRQFTDGEYFEQHLNAHHLNLMHEGWRYANCYIQDWWTMKHGSDFVGHMWRESRRPEDPIEVYKRMCNLTQDEFCNEQMEGYMRMATWDIDGIRDAAKHRIGQHLSINHLNKVGGTTNTWQTDVEHCIQNYGYHIINMNVPTKAGTVVKAYFKGITGNTKWRCINTSKAGWRYAFVAYTSNEQRVYGEIGSDIEGETSLVIPTDCQRLFFVVMGAPTEHWHHPWDDDDSNDEQWPYQVRFEGTNPLGK